MPQSRSPTSSRSSYDADADQMKDGSTAKSSSLGQEAAGQTSKVPVGPREASTNLSLQQRIRNAGGKRPAQDERAMYRMVKSKTESNRTNSSGAWSLVKSDGEAAGRQSPIRPISSRQEHRVRNRGDSKYSKSDSDTDYIVVEEGNDEFVPETSMGGPKPSAVTPCQSDVNGGHMTRSNVSSTQTHSASDNYNNNNITNRNFSFSVARLTAESITAALVGVGSQFANPSPFIKISVDDWIKV